MNSMPSTPYSSIIRQHGPRRRASVTTATPRVPKVSFALSPTRVLKRVRSKTSEVGSVTDGVPVPGLVGTDDNAGDSDDEDSEGVPTPVIPECSSFAEQSPFPDLANLALSPAAKAFTPPEPAKSAGQTQAGADVFALLQQMHARALAGELVMRSDRDGNGVYFRLPTATWGPAATAATGPGVASSDVGNATAVLGSAVPSVGHKAEQTSSSSSFNSGSYPPGLGLGFGARVSSLPSYQSAAATDSYNPFRSLSSSQAETTYSQPGTRLPSYASEAPAGHNLGPPLNLAPITPLPRFATQLQTKNPTRQNGQGTHGGQNVSRYQAPHQRNSSRADSGQMRMSGSGSGHHGGGHPGHKQFERTPAVKARPNTLKWSGPKTDVMCALEEGQVLSRKGKMKLFDPVKGFGFIADGQISALAGRDIFVHYTAIRIKVGFRALWLGEEVEYNLVQVASGGYQALNVRGADGKPLRGLDSFDPTQIADNDCSMDSPEASPQRKLSSSSARHPHHNDCHARFPNHAQGHKPAYPRRDTCQATW